MTEDEKVLREAALVALRKREGWADTDQPMRDADGSFSCGWHEQFYLDFKAGADWANSVVEARLKTITQELDFVKEVNGALADSDLAVQAHDAIQGLKAQLGEALALLRNAQSYASMPPEDLEKLERYLAHNPTPIPAPAIYQVEWRGLGGGGWVDVEKGQYLACKTNPKEWNTRVIRVVPGSYA